ncbi:MAG: ATP-dependent zinc metalloprotease FtsH [Coriobacteriales bacterium]|nr:ATP-dependent zinc metalloprotease FtsH [Coriobacteriales bacterium]
MDVNESKKRRTMIAYILIGVVVLVLLNTLLAPQLGRSPITKVPYTQLLQMADANQVDQVEYNLSSGDITFTSKDEAGNTLYYSTTYWPDDTSLLPRLEACGATATTHIENTGMNTMLIYLLTFFLPILIFVWFGWRINKRLKKELGEDGPSMSFGGFGQGLGASGAKIVAQKETGVTFADVAGQDEAKEALTEIVDFLDKPERYEEIGAKLPRGALLVGPPGTGKTLLAKAVAGEAKVPFFSISGSEFVEMFVGRGAAKVRDLFKQAKDKAPCIVFIDEIDTIGKRRDTAGFTSNDEREQTLNQLLTEMDGFDNHKGIVVLGATNRPETLDPALLRPGRFDRRVHVELPDLAGRTAILKLHAKNVKFSGAVDFGSVARATSGASGADLANIVNEAALRAVRMGRKGVTEEDLHESVEVVIAGQQRKNAVLSDKEKKIVAYHEIGHALVAAKQSHSAPVTKITIVPRTSGALGYTMQVDEDEHFLTSEQEALEKLSTLCGGRAAEDLIFNSATTGAANDIEQATKLARNMITRFGMSKQFGMVALGTVNNPYLNSDTSLTCSEGTAQKVDEEVVKLVGEAYERASQILKENRFKLHELAGYLMRKESITGDEFMAMLNDTQQQGDVSQELSE